jgi:hypothetical protein
LQIPVRRILSSASNRVEKGFGIGYDRVVTGSKCCMEHVMEHLVMVYFSLSGEKFGSAEERSRLQSLSEKLDELITTKGVGEFDGDDFGEGECIFYMYGPDADVLYSTIEPSVRSSSLAVGAKIVRQYGSPDDPDVRVVTTQL